MLSLDTNILLYAHNADCDEHASAYDFLTACGRRDDVVICELVLVEFYLLLRNPAVLASPLSPKEAVTACHAYRRNPSWRLVDCAPVMNDVWTHAAQTGVARRRIIDTRLGLTLRHNGVTELATVNTKDFKGLGFDRVWNPLT